MEAGGRECLKGFRKEGKKYKGKKGAEEKGCKGSIAGMFSITFLFFFFFFFHMVLLFLRILGFYFGA